MRCSCRGVTNEVFGLKPCINGKVVGQGCLSLSPLPPSRTAEQITHGALIPRSMQAVVTRAKTRCQPTGATRPEAPPPFHLPLATRRRRQQVAVPRI